MSEFIILRRTNKNTSSIGISEDRYYRTRNAVWSFIINHKICRLPVDLPKIFDEMGITVLSFEDARPYFEGVLKDEYFDESSSFTIFYKDKTIVVYDQNQELPRLRFTLAHELGHIVLDHKNEKTPLDLDAEADLFAARLLMPSCVLKELRVQDAEELSLVCEVSYSAAKARFERLEKLRSRNKFLTNELEKQVSERFKPFIEEYLAYYKRKK